MFNAAAHECDVRARFSQRTCNATGYPGSAASDEGNVPG
jgi:hypothetical protein